MQRGEVWWAELEAPSGPRPVLLLSRDEAYDRRTHVTVGPITTRVRGLRTEVMLGPSEGLPQTSVVNLDNIGTVAKRALARPMGVVSPAKMLEVAAAIRFALALPEGA